MKVVLPADTTFVQIIRIPVELCVCRKDLKFNAILNQSDWGTFNEPKYDQVTSILIRYQVLESWIYGL